MLQNENLDLHYDDDDNDNVEFSENFEPRFVLFSKNEQDFAYSDGNINELLKKVRKMGFFF